MDNNRKIELFNLVILNLINEKPFFQFGICQAIHRIYKNEDLKVTNDEFVFLQLHLINNKPTRDNEYSEFTKNEYWRDNTYWWEAIDDFIETKQIRVDYLTKLISNIK